MKAVKMFFVAVIAAAAVIAQGVPIDVRYLTEDRPADGAETISRSEALVFKSGGDEIYGQLLRPNAAFGEGRPVVIFAHGFAGFTRMDDVAQALCRAGCVVLVPHHRGAWGSQGKYSVANIIDDIVNLVDYVVTEPVVQKYHADPKAVFLCGYSMGGNTVLQAALRRPQVRGVVLQAPCDIAYCMRSAGKDQALKFLADNGLDVLRTDGAEALYREISDRADELSFATVAPKLKGRNVLLATGSYDHVVPAEPIDGFWTALGTNDAVRVRKTYPTSHGFMGVRVALAKDIAEFMLKCLRSGQKSVRFDSGRCWAEKLSSDNMVK